MRPKALVVDDDPDVRVRALAPRTVVIMISVTEDAATAKCALAPGPSTAWSSRSTSSI